MCAQGLAKQCVLGPVGVLAHGSGNVVEHEVLVVVMYQAVVKRQHLDLGGQLRHERYVGRQQCHRLQCRRFAGFASLLAFQHEGRPGVGNGQQYALAVENVAARYVVVGARHQRIGPVGHDGAAVAAVVAERSPFCIGYLEVARQFLVVYCISAIALVAELPSAVGQPPVYLATEENARRHKGRA